MASRSRHAKYSRWTISTLLLLIVLISIKAARYRAHIRHTSLIQPAVIASSSRSSGRPFHEVNSVALPKISTEAQLDFCRTGLPDTTDQAANMIRVSVAFHKLKFMMFCYKEQDIVSTRIRKTGAWEAASSSMALGVMEKACKKLSIPKESAVFLDIGANIGWYSLLFAAAGHSVISFEPMQANKNLFRRSICSNPDFQQRMTYHADMLSDTPHKNCTLFSGEANLGDGTVSCDQNLRIPSNYYVRETSVNMTTLDIVLADLHHPVFMVKMDVEGHEGHVLQGATKTILQAQVPYLMFEFGYAWVKQSGGDPDGLLKSLVEAGYQFSFKKFYGKPFDPLVYYADIAKQESGDIPNIYCVHNKMLSLGIERKYWGLGWLFG